MFNILVCDDEKDIVSALRIYLSAEGYKVYEAYTGKQALGVIESNDIQLVLMDIMMPEMDGLTTVSRLREEYNIPVIMLTAKGEDTDKVLGLNIGADDYITKPFNPVEVLARVRSQLRRYTQLGSRMPEKQTLSVGGLELDNKGKQVTIDGERVSLTSTEYEMLKLLMENPGQVFSPKSIYNRVWNEEAIGAEGTVAVHLRHLREKIEIDPGNPRYLKVVWGQGYKVDTKRLLWDFKSHGENLNNISSGMSAALDERIKSERLKTELITNVSHDIKTPLTSIINYVDLIKKEDIENETVQKYVEVLDRQSTRLKKLIEDLVEASKASTGNIKVDMAPCEVGVLLNQMQGEYEDKLKAAGLELIIKQPEESIRIMADGRHMWRIMDNLMNNICKYAQPSTRVYINLEVKDNRAVITFKNVSKYELNISADELMERFVRGDTSRNTEGSGLGLSIAKSLTELQGGRLELDIDGDLFKVIISFNMLQLMHGAAHMWTCSAIFYLKTQKGGVEADKPHQRNEFG